MAVTTSSGNGFALYNGNKLPNINNLEINHSIKAAFIIEVDVSAYADGKFYYLEAPLNAGTSVNYYLGTTSAVVAAAAQLGLQLDGVGVWTESEVSVPSYFDYTFVWCDEGFSLDSDLAQYVSEPIPLDGMTVIEWDGDTTGMTLVADIYYKVSDYFKPIQAYGVLNGTEGITVTDQITEQGTDRWVSHDRSGFYATGNSEENYVGLMSVGGNYTSLFAYRTTEPTYTYDRTQFLSGLAMGLTGKGDPTFAGGTDAFTKGYLTGAELRRKRVIPKAT